VALLAYSDGVMRDSASELLRIRLPRTWVNRSYESTRGYSRGVGYLCDESLVAMQGGVTVLNALYVSLAAGGGLLLLRAIHGREKA
jgi:hypothetical protein